MQFTPKTEQQINEERLIPAGDYDFKVKVALDQVSNAGNPMIKLTIGCYMDNGSMRYVDDWLLESIAYKLRHFCETVGVIDQYEDGTLDANDLPERCGRVRIAIQKAKGNFPDKNVVKDYLVDQKRDLKPAPTFVNKPLPGEEDDLPPL